MILAALPDGFFARLFIEGAVVLSDSPGRCIDDDVTCRDHLLDRSRDLDSRSLECRFLRDIRDIKRVSAFVGNQRLTARSRLGNADYLHIFLCRDGIGNSLADCSVSVDCNLYHYLNYHA